MTSGFVDVFARGLPAKGLFPLAYFGAADSKNPLP